MEFPRSFDLLNKWLKEIVKSWNLVWCYSKLLKLNKAKKTFLHISTLLPHLLLSLIIPGNFEGEVDLPPWNRSVWKSNVRRKVKSQLHIKGYRSFNFRFYVSIILALCSRPNSKGRLRRARGGGAFQFHVFSADAGKSSEDLYLKWQDSNETWETCKCCNLDMSLQNLPVNWMGPETQSTHTATPSWAAWEMKEKPEEERRWWASAETALWFTGSSACWSWACLVMEKFGGETLHRLENYSFVSFKLSNL